MIEPARQLAFESTGELPLDLILGGGIPSNSLTLIAGAPGSGKTILTLQMLFHAARQGKNSLYFTALSEPAAKVIRYMQAFDFFDAKQLDDRIGFVDLGDCIKKGFESTLAEISRRVEAAEPAFVAIDSFRSIGDQLGHPGGTRAFIYDLANEMAGWGATTFLVGEYQPEEFASFAEFAVADGIIRLGSQTQGLTSVRELEVLKLRGSEFVSGRHFFEIRRRGVAVYPRVRAPTPSDTFAIAERAATGIAELDRLLDGGIPRGSATVVQGGTGAGKTILGLNFLLEGARAGRRGIVFTHEETPSQLRAVAAGLGWDLAALEAKELLVIKYVSPVELSTDRFLNEAQREVHALKADRAVFDGLTTMALGVPSERRFKELVYALCKHMRSAGVTVLLTMEAEQLIGASNLSGLGVSFIADNLIQLRYLEMEGRLERALSVVKARGVNLNTELRKMTIGQGGLRVAAEGFKDLRGVLSGLPTPR